MWHDDYVFFIDDSGIVPATTIQTDIYWKEMDGDSEWVRLLVMQLTANAFDLLF